MDEDIIITKRVIKILGMVLLGIYIGMSIISPGFREVSGRFVALFFAITKDFSTGYALVPVYINWLSSEYFQEKIKTSLGNAAKNGFTGLWVSVEWIRTTYIKFEYNPNPLLFTGKIIISILVLLYGVLIIRAAAKGESIVSVVGRVREVSYIAIVVTPIVYEVVPFDLTTLIAIIVFYPLFYGLTEFFIDLLPTPPGEG